MTKKLYLIAALFLALFTQQVASQGILMEFQKSKNQTLREGQFPSRSYPNAVNPNDINWSVEPFNEPASGDTAPAYLVPFYDATTGAKITRVGDQTAFGVTGGEVQHSYSSNAAWNSDGTMIKLNVQPANIIDGVTYAPIYTRSLPSDHHWSNTKPNIIYGVRNGNQFVQLNVATNTETVLHTFTGYTGLSNGYGEGRISSDDNYVVLTGTNGGNTWLISYNITTDNIIAELQLPSGDLDHAEISNSGNYVLVHWRPDGSGANEGFKVYDRDLTNLRHLHNDTGHGDCGTSIQGNEVWVQFNDDLNGTNTYFDMIRLDNGAWTGLYYDTATPSPRGVWGGHISCRNLDRPGWAYVSEGEASNEVMKNEIFALMLDETGVNLVERYGKHYATPNSSGQGYWHESKACVNRDGTKIIFASAWNNAVLESWFASPSWVLEWPQQTLGLQDNLQEEESPIKTVFIDMNGKMLTDLRSASTGIYIANNYYSDRVTQRKFIHYQ